MKTTNIPKSLLSILILTIFILLSIATSKKESLDEDPNNISALSEIRKEIKVKEAIITDANVLYVSVEDDGTKRNGYADYLCEILRKKNSTVDKIKIVRVNSTNDSNKNNAYGVLLGESDCK